MPQQKISSGPIVAWVAVGITLIGLVVGGAVSVKENTAAIRNLNRTLEKMEPAIDRIAELDRRLAVNEEKTEANRAEIKELKGK